MLTNKGVFALASIGASVVTAIATTAFILYTKEVAKELSKKPNLAEAKFKIGECVKFNNTQAMIVAVLPQSIRVDNNKYVTGYNIRLQNSNVVTACEFEIEKEN